MESNRIWSCGGYVLDDGCAVTGIKFTFDGIPLGSHGNNIILHCWCQFHFVGTPHVSPVPQSRDSRLTSNKKVRRIIQWRGFPYSSKNQEEGSLLPPNFLTSFAHSFHPHDASGMLVLHDTSLGHYPKRFGHIRRIRYSPLLSHGPIPALTLPVVAWKQLPSGWTFSTASFRTALQGILRF